jgi:hypothetical protein
VTLQPEDDDLDQYEAWAHDWLSPLLGPLRRVDRRGGPPGLHDFEADLADGSVAALEVTGEVDAQRLRLASSAERRFSAITLADSESLWLVGLAPGARVSAIRPDDLRLTHLWLLPAFTVTREVLRWVRDGGWGVLEQKAG